MEWHCLCCMTPEKPDTDRGIDTRSVLSLKSSFCLSSLLWLRSCVSVLLLTEKLFKIIFGTSCFFFLFCLFLKPLQSGFNSPFPCKINNDIFSLNQKAFSALMLFDISTALDSLSCEILFPFCILPCSFNVSDSSFSAFMEIFRFCIAYVLP